MPNHNALGIANELIDLSGHRMAQMKLQKLVYLSHAWNLAINQQPLVMDPILAWDNGPVIQRIWNHIRDWGYNCEKTYFGDPRNDNRIVADITDEERLVINHVWGKYGVYSGRHLSELTHQPGTPWTNAYFRHGRNSRLSNDEIQQHITELAIAGRRAD